MIESKIEQNVGKLVKANNGLYLKWVCPGVTGVPDRICLFPNGKIIFMELKRPERKDGRSERQKRVLSKLQDFGFTAVKVNSLEQAERIIEAVIKYDL